MYCKNCGKEIEDDSVYCRYCGALTQKESITECNNTCEPKKSKFTIKKVLLYIYTACSLIFAIEEASYVNTFEIGGYTLEKGGFNLLYFIELLLLLFVFIPGIIYLIHSLYLKFKK